MNIIVDSTFNPFSYRDLMQPVYDYKQAYEETEAAYADLVAQTEAWKDIANKENSPEAYAMYKSYSDQLNAIVDDFSQGMNPRNRRQLLGMKRRYASDIIPIARASEAMQAANALRDQASPDAIFEEGRYTSLDRFLHGQTANNKFESRKDIVARTAALAQATAQSILEDPIIKQSMNPQFLEVIQKRGLGSLEELQAAIAGNPAAANRFAQIRNQMIDQIGGLDRFDAQGRAAVEGAINEGLYAGLNNYKTSLQQNSEYIPKAQRGSVVQNNAVRGNLPIDIHHLVSPNQVGEQGDKMVEQLRAKLGLAKTYDGKTAKWATTVDLKNLVTGKSDMFTHTFENSSGGTTVRLFNQKGELLNRDSVVRQGGSKASQKALGEWYDSMYSTLKTHFKSDKNGRWTTNSILSQMNDIKSGKGAITMGAMRINFGADNNQKALEALLPGMTNGDKTSIYEITSFDSNGQITKGNRASTKDFLDDKGKAKSTPMFYAAPNANTDGLIMQFNGKTYLIPRNKLGSLGEQVYNINIPELQKANQLKQQLIKTYGADAYYSSQEGQIVEQTIDNYGAAYLRAAGTALGYSYNLPKYDMKVSNQTEI